MNLQNIFNKIEEVDPEVYKKMDTRRTAMKDFASMAGKVTIASLPFVVGSMFKKAYGAAPSRSVTDVLNFALTLEYLEATFYNMGTSMLGGSFGANEKAGLAIITYNENHHVTFLQSAITAAGATPVAQSSFAYDYTAGGNFKDVFTNYDTFLGVAQTFEDTGVRAYKGQAGYLIGNPVLTAALNIHSVEARHAAFLRQVRHIRGVKIKPWITGAGLSASGIPIAAVNPTYAGEDNTQQNGGDIVGVGMHSKITMDAATECFDEPLTTDQVVAIAKNFITKGL